MKKRYILYGVIGLEILALPFSAGAIHHVMSSNSQYAVLTELPSEPGVSRLVVSSNAPFVLSAEGASTPMDIRVNVSGYINAVRFGDDAQLPGLPAYCANPQNPSMMAVYTSQRATSTTDADILSQSVVLDIQYDATKTPHFSVETVKAGRNIPKAPACGSAPV